VGPDVASSAAYGERISRTADERRVFREAYEERDSRTAHERRIFRVVSEER